MLGDQLLPNKMANVYYLRRFEGHSMARTTLIEKDGKEMVRKETYGEQGLGAAKLEQQCNWLVNLPEVFKPYFPKVYSQHKGEDYFSYDMRHYDLPALADLYHSGLYSEAELYSILSEVIHFCSTDLYNYKTATCPNDFITTNILDKLRKRIEISEEMSEAFGDFNNFPEFEFDSLGLRNPKQLLQMLAERDWLNRLSPKTLGFTHGDLTFGNILVDGDSFFLIDPQGEEYNSLFYDLAKVYQSSSRSFELLLKGEISAKIEGNKIDSFPKSLFATNQANSDTLFNFLEGFPSIINEPFWKDKIFFFAAAHYIGAVPFRLKDGGLTSGILSYLFGAVLLEKVMANK